MRKTFTLIELIVVIAILGILSSIVIPNINNVNGKATHVAVAANVKNLQTALDMYYLDHGDFPTKEIPTIKIPQPIQFEKIKPEYVRQLPKTKGFHYWVDFRGEVWSSSVEAPDGMNNNNGYVRWNGVDGASSYIIYEIVDSSKTSAVQQKYKLKQIATSLVPSYANGEAGKEYIVSAVDRSGYQTVPSGAGYEPASGGNNTEPPDPNPTTPQIKEVDTTPIFDSQTFAKTVYIDSVNGSEAGKGTLDSPYKSILKAMSELQLSGVKDNIVIVMNDGVYDWTNIASGTSDNMDARFNGMKIKFIPVHPGKVTISSTHGFETLVSQNNANYRIKLSFYGIIFKNITGGFATLGGDDWTNEYYNCVFDTVELGGWNGVVPTTNAKVVHSVFKDTTRSVLSTLSPITGEFVNNASTNDYVGMDVGTPTTSLLNTTVENDYKVPDGVNKGTGLDTDNTAADIGVYGGEYTWYRTSYIDVHMGIDPAPTLFNKDSFAKVVYVDAVSGNDTTGAGDSTTPVKSVRKAMDMLYDSGIKANVAVVMRDGNYDFSTVTTGNSFNVDTKFNQMKISFIAANPGKVSISSNKGLELLIVETNTSYRMKFSFYGIIFKNVTNDFFTLGGDDWVNEFYNCVFDTVTIGGWAGYVKNTSVKVVNSTFRNATYNSFHTSDPIGGESMNSVSTNTVLGIDKGTYTTTLSNVALDANYKVTSASSKDTGTGLDVDGTKADLGVYGGAYSWNYTYLK